MGLDNPRLSELFDLSEAAREMRGQFKSSLQQAQIAQIAHKYGSLKDSMRQSRLFVSHILTFPDAASLLKYILEPLAILDPLFPSVYPFLGYVPVRTFNRSTY